MYFDIDSNVSIIIHKYKIVILHHFLFHFISLKLLLYCICFVSRTISDI